MPLPDDYGDDLDLDTQFAPSITLGEGESVRGIVVGVDRARSKFPVRGKPADDDDNFYPIVTIEQAGGNEVAFHGFHGAAKKGIERAAPVPGDTIGIKYLGRADDPDNQNPHRYTVKTRRPTNASNAPAAEELV